MANEEHHKILMQAGVAWLIWRSENREIQLDLSGVDLRGTDLSGVAGYVGSIDLSHANLSRANLHKVDLRGANLSSANLINANLSGANLINANLSGANLSSANLRDADLSSANLSDANLSDANLGGANLINADLRDANLRDADLSSANLRGAKFGDADLTGAILFFTEFFDANLNGANLRRAHLGNAIFEGDLSQTQELQDVINVTPSCISTSTLERTAAGLAQDATRQWAIEAFYRGAGVEDHLIEYFRSRIGQPIEFYSCFISYSHADKSFARRVYSDLQARGIRCWLDEHQLLPGDDIYDAVDRGIRLWDKTLLCCSEASLTSWWVDSEIGTAFEKERRLMEDRGEKTLSLIPLNLDDFLFTGKWRSSKAQVVRSRLAADFTGWESSNAKFDEQLERVAKALRTGEGSREAPPAPKP